MNTVQLIGRIANDLELRHTNSGIACTSFAVAVDKSKDKDGNDLGADFPRVTVFGKQAENVCRYLSKGRQIGVVGRLETGSYEKEGQTHFTTTVIAQRVEFLGGNQQHDGNQHGNNQQHASSQQPAHASNDDFSDLPWNATTGDDLPW